jgi:hypothetical protein
VIKASSQDDGTIGIKGFSSAFNLLLMGANGANGFLTYIAEDPTVLVHVGFSDLGEIAASTDYMIKGKDVWRTAGANLRGAYAALDGPVSRVGASIELNNRAGTWTLGYLDVARVLAHELALHAMSIEIFRERILARDEELLADWPALVAPGGQLSQQNQHAGAAFDLNANYEPLIENMCAKLRSNGHDAHANVLRRHYENDILHLKIEYAKREMGADYVRHHLLEGVEV